MHTGREGMSAMPYFDDFDLSTVDILLISQYVVRFLAPRPSLFAVDGDHMDIFEGFKVEILRQESLGEGIDSGSIASQ